MPESSRTDWPKIARRIRVPLGFVFAVLYFWLAQPTWRFIALGAILIVPGLLIRALASGHVRKNEALATSGPYAYTRNPLYLGSLLIGIGFAVAARSWWVGVLLVAMFFAIYLPVIRDEEAFLRQKFPEFEDYARRVPRMFPKNHAEFQRGRSVWRILDGSLSQASGMECIPRCAGDARGASVEDAIDEGQLMR